mmetsp:Transcript_45180/g.51272  ORF Transcript_45180/g.51272 Transcript_45180/m.51272 type:complete len:112 (-) Transcript_45180:364-699(-)
MFLICHVQYIVQQQNTMNKSCVNVRDTAIVFYGNIEQSQFDVSFPSKLVLAASGDDNLFLFDIDDVAVVVSIVPNVLWFRVFKILYTEATTTTTTTAPATIDTTTIFKYWK